MSSSQLWIPVELDTLQAEVNALKRPHSKTAAEFDALLNRAFKGR